MAKEENKYNPYVKEKNMYTQIDPNGPKTIPDLMSTMGLMIQREPKGLFAKVFGGWQQKIDKLTNENIMRMSESKQWADRILPDERIVTKEDAKTIKEKAYQTADDIEAQRKANYKYIKNAKEYEAWLQSPDRDPSKAPNIEVDVEKMGEIRDSSGKGPSATSILNNEQLVTDRLIGGTVKSEAVRRVGIEKAQEIETRLGRKNSQANAAAIELYNIAHKQAKEQVKSQQEAAKTGASFVQEILKPVDNALELVNRGRSLRRNGGW